MRHPPDLSGCQEVNQGKLFLNGIEKALANRGLVLLGIGEDGLPAEKDEWTMTTYNASPVKLMVASKPGKDTISGSGVCMGVVVCMFQTRMLECLVCTRRPSGMHNTLYFTEDLCSCSDATVDCFKAA